MDTLPKPECPWNERQAQEDKKNNRNLILGFIVAAVSLAAVSGVNLICLIFYY